MIIEAECPCCGEKTRYKLTARVQAKKIVVEKAVKGKDFTKLSGLKLISAELRAVAP